MIGVYGIFHSQSGRFYLGISKHIERRWEEHTSSLETNQHHNRYLQNAWNKYGGESFEFKVIIECSMELASTIEMHLVMMFRDLVFNIRSGGNYKYSSLSGLSPEDRQLHSVKMSLVHKGIWDSYTPERRKERREELRQGVIRSRTPEFREGLSARKKKWWQNASEEQLRITKSRLSQSHLGRTNPPISEATRQKMSDSAKARTVHSGTGRHRPHTEETKEKLRQANLGKKLSEETRRKMSEGQKRRQREKREQRQSELSQNEPDGGE